MAIAKLLLLLLLALALHYATTAPNARPPTDELRKQRGAERVVPFFTPIIRILIWTWALLESSVPFALSGHCPPRLAHLLYHLHPTTTTTANPSLTTLTPTFLAGALLVLAGALLRAHCFRALGPRFTFELSIRPAHTLVTHGAYGIVRHPSYSGGLAVLLGWPLCVLDRPAAARGWLIRAAGVVYGVCAAWSRASGGEGNGSDAGADGASSAAVLVTYVWAVALGVLGVMCVAMNERMNKEDAMLEENFGEEWRVWARRVRWRMIPGVY